jgi:hypothetical protein
VKHPVQGDLFASSAGASTESLRRFLSEAGNCRVDLTLTRNRVTMASVSFVTEGHARVRLHAQFITAPQNVWEALASYVRTRRRPYWNTVAAHAQTIDTSSEARQPSSAPLLRDKGEIYDLGEIAKSVNLRFFNGRIKYQIGWGRGRPRKRQRGLARGRSIRYGSWSRTTRTIRIHPLLDDSRVPRKFVEYIVFHEMLHAVVPSDRSSGRRYDHPEAFRVLERSFPNLPEMKVLASELLRMLV